MVRKYGHNYTYESMLVLDGCTRFMYLMDALDGCDDHPRGGRERGCSPLVEIRFSICPRGRISSLVEDEH